MDLEAYNRLIDLIHSTKNNFPNLFHQAVDTLRKRRVKKYFLSNGTPPLYIVVGENKDYLVEVLFDGKLTYSCSCPDFLYNVTPRLFRDSDSLKGRYICYHVLAVLISLIGEVSYHTVGKETEFFRRSIFLPDILMEYEEYASLLI